MVIIKKCIEGTPVWECWCPKMYIIEKQVVIDVYTGTLSAWAKKVKSAWTCTLKVTFEVIPNCRNDA